jgi:hypothetical protein
MRAKIVVRWAALGERVFGLAAERVAALASKAAANALRRGVPPLPPTALKVPTASAQKRQTKC